MSTHHCDWRMLAFYIFSESVITIIIIWHKHVSPDPWLGILQLIAWTREKEKRVRRHTLDTCNLLIIIIILVLVVFCVHYIIFFRTKKWSCRREKILVYTYLLFCAMIHMRGGIPVKRKKEALVAVLKCKAM